MSEDPQTEYEKMLDRRGLDCSLYGCWKPIAAFVWVEPGKGDGRGAHDEAGVCADHARKLGKVTRWLEQ